MVFAIKRIINVLLIASRYSPFALIWMAKAFLLDWPARKWSFWRFPQKVKDMGLHYIESDYTGDFGYIKGRIQGHEIEIKPDDGMNSSIRVAAHSREGGLEISLSRSKTRIPKNMREFKTANWKFNWAFRTKWAHVHSVERVARQNGLIDSLVEFYSRWMFTLDSLFIDDGQVYCRFKYGFYFFPYIPACRIERIVEQLVAIAEEYDAFFGNG